MGSTDFGYSNVQRLALAIGSSDAVVLPITGPPQHYDRKAFVRRVVLNTVQDMLGRLDVPVMLALMVAAVLKRRKAKVALTGQGPFRVLHIITSLGAGGAQVQLAEFLARTPRDKYRAEVLVLNRDDGNFSLCRFRAPDVPVTYLERWPSLTASLWEIRNRCLDQQYDIVHTWLFYANFLGGAGARLAGCPRIIGSVRNLSLWKRTWYNRRWFRLADILASAIADVVTVNAKALVKDHSRWALMPSRSIRVIHNGLEPAEVLPAAEGAYGWLRKTLNVAPDCRIVGAVGRLAHEKDHATFLRMLSRLEADFPGIHGVLVGDGELRHRLENLVVELGLQGNVTFMGQRKDSRRIIAGLDAFVLTSVIEGFPNVLLEATMLGIPSLATEVGAARDVLLDSRDLFKPGDDEAAGNRCKEILAHPEAAQASAQAVRERVLTHFTADRMTSRWVSLYDEWRRSPSMEPVVSFYSGPEEYRT
jgi:glycosyltransferase involved in cell wall biosynthesis